MNAMPDSMRRPAVLKRDDTIALAAPAGPIADEVFREGLERLRAAGLEPVFSAAATGRAGYLAAPDRERVHDLVRWLDAPETRAILAVRGGYGSGRLLPLLDLALFARRPKILMGFSDLTFLLNAVAARARLVTFHGPMLSTLVRDGEAAVNRLNALRFPRWEPLQSPALEILRPGTAAGPLFGGNLSCFCHLIATEFEPPLEGAILVLEDIGEPLYRIDRMLTHLAMSGRLTQVAGVILGGFCDRDLRPMPETEAVWARALELIPAPIPVWGNFPAGHGPENEILPIGAQVVMDSGTGALSFPEPILSRR